MKQAPDLMTPPQSELQRNHEQALCAYEAQHAIWFNTVVDSDAGRRAKAKLKELEAVYIAANHAAFPEIICIL